ncbi:MotA/TolQ/ExbB proton channel family protein [Salmonella enterica subsp. enterica]|nr:MotA/TolQ/ExbB proton channel family protein [Salmonella enterica subsp. enterica]
MYFFGIITYIVTALSYAMFPAIKNMLTQAVLLAPQISYACGILFLFPLIIFSCHLIFKMKARKNYVLLATQTKLAASVAVSLGLIGTFMGLTDMISAIAGSLGGEGDMTQKMGAMIASISSALNAMSFAFLTSILGVSVSVLLLISLNFWEFFYLEDVKDKPNKNSDKSDLEERLAGIEKINAEISGKLISVPENADVTNSILIALKEVVAEAKLLNEKTENICRISNETMEKNFVLHKELFQLLEHSGTEQRDCALNISSKLQNITDECSDIKTLIALLMDKNNEQQSMLLEKLTSYENYKINLNKKMKSIAEIIIDEK